MRRRSSEGFVPKSGDSLVIEAAEMTSLLAALRARGHTPIGPTVRDGAIVLAEIDDASPLPAGWADDQDGGRYRLKRRDDGALFGHAVGPHSWKRWLHPPTVVRWRAHRDSGGFVAEPERHQPPLYAFIGVRPCELAAILVQDRVFLGGPFVDPAYRSRREGAFVVAVQCSSPSGTCFCASMGTGPRAESAFDLALTEILGGPRHEIVVEVGSDRGAAVASAIPHRPAEAADLEAAAAVAARARASMGRSLETDGLKDALYRRYEDSRWDEVGRRCLGCANCTMVCPTCFCATVEDATDLAGTQTERRRVWDSCFSQEFSYVHGGSVRTSAGARYRQWITHKLATWHDQFGVSGCVGCGRCITWCPVGIDITAEARAVRPADAQGSRP
jgi:formate hydrogenlyase subunit 6/NADH:ubiquinone oxidoreductase subunit I